MARKADGVRISQLLPLLAAQSDRFSLIRSMSHGSNAHETATYIAQTGRDDDEPFRFVPQPVVDWLMDHLHLVERDTDYRTMEARALLFLLERCGRRPVEILHLRDDCLSFDSSGHPFLEWERIKAPRSAGKRLPIHRETHDLIRQWQKVKSECGIESQWLFPSSRYRHRDDPYGTGYLLSRLRELVTAVLEHAPYPGRVEGADLLDITPIARRGGVCCHDVVVRTLLGASARQSDFH